MKNTKRIFGYARVSTTEQDLGRQIKALLEFGVTEEMIYHDKKTGADMNRPEYQRLKMQILRPGDTLVMKSVDRFSRSVSEGVKDYRELEDHGINLIFIDNPQASTESMKKLRERMSGLRIGEGEESFLIKSLSGAVNQIVEAIVENTFISEFERAEKERSILRKRVKEGMEKAKASGTKSGRAIGRPRTEITEELKEDLHTYVNTRKLSGPDIMKKYNLKESTFYKILREYKIENDLL